MKKLIISVLYSNLTLLVFISILYPRNDAKQFFSDLEAHQDLNFSEIKMLNQPNIRLNDYYGEYSTFDSSFFPPGKTPKYMCLSFSDIKLGELWSSLGLPYLQVSGTYICTNVAINQWTYEKDELEITFLLSSSHFRAYAAYHIGTTYYTIFLCRVGNWPYFSDKNYLSTWTGNYFYEGFFQASWLADVDPVSIKITAESLGFGAEEHTFYAGIAKTSTTGTYRISRLSDATCIKIKVDKSQSAG